MAEVVVIRVEMDGLHEKIFMPTKLLKGESQCLCWGPIGSRIPKGSFGAKSPCLSQILK